MSIQQIEQAERNILRYSLEYPTAAPKEQPNLYDLPRLVLDHQTDRFRLHTDGVDYEQWPMYGSDVLGVILSTHGYRIKREERRMYRAGRLNQIVCTGWSHTDGHNFMIGNGHLHGQDCHSCVFALPQGSVDVPMVPACQERIRILMISVQEPTELAGTVFWFLDVPLRSALTIEDDQYSAPKIVNVHAERGVLEAQTVESLDLEITGRIMNSIIYNDSVFRAMGAEYAAMTAAGMDI